MASKNWYRLPDRGIICISHKTLSGFPCFFTTNCFDRALFYFIYKKINPTTSNPVIILSILNGCIYSSVRP